MVRKSARFITGPLPAALLLMAASAEAQSYRLTYAFNGASANQVLTTAGAANSDGLFAVSSLSGTFGGATVSLLPPGTLGDNNNLFKPTAGYFDFYGIAFNAGGTVYNLYTVSDGRQFLCTGTPACQGGAVSTFTVTPLNAAIPEPVTWALMVLGFGAVGFGMRRRVRASEMRFDTKIKQISEGADA